MQSSLVGNQKEKGAKFWLGCYTEIEIKGQENIEWVWLNHDIILS